MNVLFPAPGIPVIAILTESLLFLLVFNLFNILWANIRSSLLLLSIRVIALARVFRFPLTISVQTCSIFFDKKDNRFYLLFIIHSPLEIKFSACLYFNSFVSPVFKFLILTLSFLPTLGWVLTIVSTL